MVRRRVVIAKKPPFQTQGVSEGSRNETLTSFAGYLRYKGLSTKAIASVLRSINQEICDPPLHSREVRAIAHSVEKSTTDEDAFGTLSDIAPEEVRWLGFPYFVRGATTVLDGNPGQGKSTFIIAIAAAVTTEQNLPFIPDLERGIVLILSAEDDPARVLKPRLLVHGADDSKIRFQRRPFTLDSRGLGLLRTEIEQHRPVMVIIDPLIAYMDSGTDLHKATDTMRFMIELDMLAREFDLAMVAVRHLRKSDSDDPLYRGLGSIAIAARVRSALFLGRHPDDPETRAVAQPKCSYAPEGETILFTLEAANGHPKVRWLGTTAELKADDLLMRLPSERGRHDKERENAKKFLRDFLEDGPKMKTNIERAAEAHSISVMTLRRASDDLGIVKRREGRQTAWGTARAKCPG
jgi:RecA-family ATPase